VIGSSLIYWKHQSEEAKFSAMTILKSKIVIFLSESAKIEIALLNRCCDLFLQQLLDVTGLNDIIIFFIIELTHDGRSRRPTAFRTINK